MSRMNPNIEWAVPQMVHIYLLIDPRDATVRYVGQTYLVSRRFLQHCKPDKSEIREHPEKVAWVEELAAAGLSPKMRVVESIAANDADAAEQRWISNLKAEGCILFNRDRSGFLKIFREASLQKRDELRIATAECGYPGFQLLPEEAKRALREKWITRWRATEARREAANISQDAAKVKASERAAASAARKRCPKCGGLKKHYASQTCAKCQLRPGFRTAPCLTCHKATLYPFSRCRPCRLASGQTSLPPRPVIACTRCGKTRREGRRADGICKPCYSSEIARVAKCVECEQVKSIRAGGLCAACHERKRRHRAALSDKDPLGVSFASNL